MSANRVDDARAPQDAATGAELDRQVEQIAIPRVHTLPRVQTEQAILAVLGAALAGITAIAIATPEPLGYVVFFVGVIGALGLATRALRRRPSQARATRRGGQAGSL